jgi:RecG-like helicase
LLAELGLYTLGDMLYYFPRRYDKYSQGIIPIYSLTEGINQKWFGNLMEQVVEYWAPNVVDTLPESIRSAARLMPISEALLNVHFPTSQDNLWAALERLTFNEVFYLQLVLLRQKREWKSAYTKHFDINDAEVIEKARSVAQRLFTKDAELSLPEHSLLADALTQFWADSSYFDDSMF